MALTEEPNQPDPIRRQFMELVDQIVNPTTMDPTANLRAALAELKEVLAEMEGTLAELRRLQRNNDTYRPEF
jgi:hypothetical protein